MINTEQIVASNKTALNNAFALGHEAFASVDKLVELNLTAARTSMTESADFLKSVMATKNPQEWLSLQTGFFQPMAEKTASYARHVHEITSESGAELSKAAESKAVEAQQQFVSFIDAALKNAPAGSESAVAFLKQAMSASHSAAESVQKAVKQATDLAESNFHAVTETAAKVSKTVAKKR